MVRKLTDVFLLGNLDITLGDNLPNLTKEAECFSEILVIICKITYCHILEDKRIYFQNVSVFVQFIFFNQQAPEIIISQPACNEATSHSNHNRPFCQPQRAW